MPGVQHLEVSEDENGMRVDRWFAARFPQLQHGRLQKMLRAGHIRIDKKRVKSNARLSAGQLVRVPPMDQNPKKSAPKVNLEDARFLQDLIIHEDEFCYVFNKPTGLAVQGGSGTKNHIDRMLKSLPNKKGDVPKLVHRLDRDTSGCLLVAKTRQAASHFGKIFQTRRARKIYWAVTVGVPSPVQGRISCFLAKRSIGQGEQMAVVENGEPGAQHSSSFYAVIDQAAQNYAWLSLKPVTGRTHQLRVHMQELGVPIIDDPRYFELADWNWVRPSGLGEGLHLHARRLMIDLPNGQKLDVSASLPAHMAQSFEFLGFDAKRFEGRDRDPEDLA